MGWFGSKKPAYNNPNAAPQQRADEVQARNYLDICSDIFQRTDLDGSGTLSSDEIKQGFLALGLTCEDPDALVREADTDKSGELDECEFVALVSKLLNEGGAGSALAGEEQVFFDFSSICYDLSSSTCL